MSIPISPLVDGKGTSSSEVTAVPRDSPDVTVVDAEVFLKEVNLRENPEARKAFLSEFSAEESKATMSKVDRRFFILIGLMFLIKNVCNPTAIDTI